MSGARFWTVGLLVLVACAADLFSSRTGLTVSAPLVLNEGVTLEVEDPEELANHTRDAAASVLTATSLTGGGVCASRGRGRRVEGVSRGHDDQVRHDPRDDGCSAVI